MKQLLDPGYWARALTHPLVVVGLVVDLLPIYGVIALGWTAIPLVLIYWMENVIAGVMTIPRIIVSGATYGGVGLAAGAGLALFFTFHYGLFCAVHGSFLMAFVSFSSGTLFSDEPPIMMDVPAMFRFGLNSGLHVDWFVYAIIAFQVLVFLVEFVAKGAWKTSNPMAEMFAPYMRIIILHFGIFAGAAALILLGQPMVGVLALIVFRALWGVVTNSNKVGLGMDSAWSEAMAKVGNREAFDKMLRGEKVE